MNCCHCCCTIFIITLYPLYTRVILILIIILILILIFNFNVQCLQIVVFSFEKGSYIQHLFSTDSCNPVKSVLYFLWRIFAYLLTLFSKILNFLFAPQEDFWEKMAKIKIVFFYLLCTIILKCLQKKSLEQMMKHKFA